MHIFLSVFSALYISKMHFWSLIEFFLRFDLHIIFIVYLWKNKIKKLCWFDVDFQNGSKRKEMFGPRSFNCMCPPLPQNCEFNCVKYSFCEPLNTCIYVKKNKACMPFCPHHTEASPLSTWHGHIKHGFWSHTMNYNTIQGCQFVHLSNTANPGFVKP